MDTLSPIFELYKSRSESWEWLKRELEPALRADENTFIAVTAEDVIQRNKR